MKAKKKVTIVICVIALIAVMGVGTVYAAGRIAEQSSIGAGNAINFAFVDAGVDPASAIDVEAEFDYEQGQFIYDVEFIADHTQYNYWIKASSGAVVKKDVKLLPGAAEAAPTETEAPEAASTEKEDTKKENTKKEGTQKTPVETQKETTSSAANPKETTTGETKPSESNASSAVDKTKKQEKADVGIDRAKAIAVGHAGVKSSDVVFSKAKLERDDGKLVYEIEFYSHYAEYDYTIDASSGTILEYETDKHEIDDDYDDGDDDDDDDNDDDD